VSREAGSREQPYPSWFAAVLTGYRTKKGRVLQPGLVYRGSASTAGLSVKCGLRAGHVHQFIREERGRLVAVDRRNVADGAVAFVTGEFDIGN